MAVQPGGLTVGGPTGVCNACMGIEDLGHVHTRILHQLAEFGHLAHLFECKDLILLVTVDGKAGGIVTSVLKAGETYIRG